MYFLVDRISVLMVITSIIQMLHKWNDSTWNPGMRTPNGCWREVWTVTPTEYFQLYIPIGKITYL